MALRFSSSKSAFSILKGSQVSLILILPYFLKYNMNINFNQYIFNDYRLLMRLHSMSLFWVRRKEPFCFSYSCNKSFISSSVILANSSKIVFSRSI